MAQIETRRRKALDRARRLLAEGKLDQAAEQEIVLELARLIAARRDCEAFCAAYGPPTACRTRAREPGTRSDQAFYDKESAPTAWPHR
jgi:hypothetical protein